MLNKLVRVSSSSAHRQASRIGARQTAGLASSSHGDERPAIKAKDLPDVGLVRFTLVDYKGRPTTLVGKEGQTMMQAAAHAGVLEDDSNGGGSPSQIRRTELWNEDNYG